jgi:pimeloyl-ACP methyl ester carboxylesterase
MQLVRIGAALCFVMLVAAPAQPQVRTEHSESVDFSKYKTFVWIKEPNATNPLSNQRIIDDVNAALTSRGLQLVTSDADVGIAAHVATDTQQTLHTFYDGFGGGWRWRDTFGSATTTVNTYTVGTLILDLFDTHTKMAIWRGTAMKTLSDNPRKNAEAITKAVAQMFKAFPPTNARLRGANAKETVMTMTKLADVEETTAIRRFRVNVPDGDLAELRRRITATRFPEKEIVTGFSQGVPLATTQKLARYWASEYDWRKVEARLNAVPNFITEIDGVDIHFIHVRSKHENALPILISHGWPGSIIEQLKLIEPLTNPTAYGGTAADAFHVVIPSMPGYGFSGKPTETGWGPERIGRAWDVLMKRLGYTNYVAQGGDWGAIIVELMGAQPPQGLLAIHTNMANCLPPAIDAAAFTGAPVPAGLSADERHAYEQAATFYKDVYYALYMGTRPQTLTAFADSPVGLATFMIDHDARSLEMIARSFDGVAEGLTRDDVLDNITLFWLTNTGVSAARLYWEGVQNKLSFFSPRGVKIPVAVSAFPDELFQAPESWVRQAYPKLIHYNRLPKGGHFAAWEQPTLFIEELRAGFKSLR